MGAFADPEPLLEQGVQGGADRTVILASSQGGPDLAEDLALANHHRVESGSDGEQVRDGGLVVVDVERCGERVCRELGAPHEQRGQILDAAVEAVHIGIYLDPVAGSQHNRLVDVSRVEHGRAQLRCAGWVDSELFEDVDRRAAVRRTDDEDAHTAPASSAPSSCALRCSWYARI